MKIQRWTPGCSFRAKFGKLWFGANLHTCSFFILYEKGPQFLSWNPTERLLIKAMILAAIIAAIVSMW